MHIVSFDAQKNYIVDRITTYEIHTYIHIPVYIHYLEMDDIVKNVTLI